MLEFPRARLGRHRVHLLSFFISRKQKYQILRTFIRAMLNRYWICRFQHVCSRMSCPLSPLYKTSASFQVLHHSKLQPESSESKFFHCHRVSLVHQTKWRLWAKASKGGGWPELWKSTDPGSTSSAGASSCCSATMTDACQPAAPATMNPLPMYLDLFLCPAQRIHMYLRCCCSIHQLLFLFLHLGLCRLDRLPWCTYIGRGMLVVLLTVYFWGFKVCWVWCGAPKSCNGKDAHVSICAGSCVRGLVVFLFYGKRDNSKKQRKRNRKISTKKGWIALGVSHFVIYAEAYDCDCWSNLWSATT